MITVYYLPVEIVDSTSSVSGVDIIHSAILECTSDPNLRKLIMDTTPDEHTTLQALAVITRPPTPEETEAFNTLVIPFIPDPDTLRAEELLVSSPEVITQPEMWELFRIIGRRLGYHF